MDLVSVRVETAVVGRECEKPTRELQSRGLGAVDRNRRTSLGQQILDHRAEFGGVPPGALVDLWSVCPTLGDPDNAPLDLEHPASDVPRLDAAQPNHKR